MIWETIPSTRYDISYKEFITFGSNKERNLVTVLFNNRLRKLAKEKNIPVLSISKYLLSNKLTTNMSYYCDPIHLSSRALHIAIKEVNKFQKDMIFDKYRRNYFLFFYCIIKKNIHIIYITLMKTINNLSNSNFHEIDDAREKEVMNLYKKDFKKYFSAINV